MKPSIGRIVHYVEAGRVEPEKHHPAVIMSVRPDGMSVDLNVMTLGLPHFMPAWGVAFDAAGKRENSWHWPERVE